MSFLSTGQKRRRMKKTDRRKIKENKKKRSWRTY
jgi:hypothetical protein